ncbi:hypothetical protein LCGC14_2953660 [marine sediment metagenome]|uniref:Uncharacterized protein n=1 Tax=marine sediment metagenome TaxID=412755 RepID=A0A0F8XF44_9ZZZZ
MSEHKCMYRDQWESVNKSRSHWVLVAEKMETEVERLEVLLRDILERDKYRSDARRESCEVKNANARERKAFMAGLSVAFPVTDHETEESHNG